MKTNTIKTKKELEAQGWVFVTTGGGAVGASKKIEGSLDRIWVNAKTLPTLRKKLSAL